MERRSSLSGWVTGSACCGSMVLWPPSAPSSPPTFTLKTLEGKKRTRWRRASTRVLRGSVAGLWPLGGSRSHTAHLSSHPLFLCFLVSRSNLSFIVTEAKLQTAAGTSCSHPSAGANQFIRSMRRQTETSRSSDADWTTDVCPASFSSHPRCPLPPPKHHTVLYLHPNTTLSFTSTQHRWFCRPVELREKNLMEVRVVEQVYCREERREGWRQGGMRE